MSPEGAKARNMASDTMLHCALKAQPNNKVRTRSMSMQVMFLVVWNKA